MGTIRLSRLHWPVTALGPGRRVGIWLQGCSIGCKGCCSRDTWDPAASTPVDVTEVLAWAAEQPLWQAEGFTISGGEPFEQPQALRELMAGLRTLPTGPIPADILVYSGYPWKTLQHRHAGILALADAVVSEPYVESRPGDTVRGSDNQRLHRLTPLALSRYPAQPPQKAASLQVHYDGRTIWMIGIPRPGDLERMRQRLLTRGVTMDRKACSWLA